MVLDTDQKAVEDKFYREVRANLDEYVERYRREYLIISTDHAREFSEDYNRSNESRARYAGAVQEPATLIIREVWQRMLQEPAAEGQLNAVVFLAGGGGSGKTTSLGDVPGLKAISDRAQILYETIFSNLQSSAQKIDQALDAGKDVAVIYVHRPIDKAAVGVLRRAVEQGRTYPIEALAEGHFFSQRSVLSLAERYENNPSVTFFVIDNSRGLRNAALTDLEFLRRNLYNSIAEVNQRAREAIDNDSRLQAEQGRPVPDYVYRGIVGDPELDQSQNLEGNLQGSGPTTRGQLEPQRRAGEPGTIRSEGVSSNALFIRKLSAGEEIEPSSPARVYELDSESGDKLIFAVEGAEPDESFDINDELLEQLNTLEPGQSIEVVRGNFRVPIEEIQNTDEIAGALEFDND